MTCESDIPTAPEHAIPEAPVTLERVWAKLLSLESQLKCIEGDSTIIRHAVIGIKQTFNQRLHDFEERLLEVERPGASSAHSNGNGAY